ncbi:MAG TPA: 4Fe-4S binding protein [Syntrophales bacterium]|nr:4Fe-4S binding protein [Syntrophales bacterium]HOM06484.1 4Fe-4S binding protein [Syntrophales bacterium]HON99869.1 4Fe-4S binding protein [Syntrophales bacterium]HPC01687.1 4Fe-4S binding protein [Syntrophales bacterium]HPQ06254.1 4Fe-4S binding protein [Syntrophales bacterium]
MEQTVSRKIVIHYTADIVDQPIICQLVKKHDLVFNILKARILPRREGVIVLELSGSKENFDAGIRFLKEKGLKVEPLSKRVNQNSDRCVHCGACTAFCPTDALSFDMTTMKVLFDKEKCNGCELCVSACPARAMEVNIF